MRKLSISLLALFLFASCAQQQGSQMNSEGEMGSMDEAPAIEMATAVISPTEGNNISGIVTFTKTDTGVRVEATVSGFEPETLHGFHIHEFGDCREPDGTSAGGHFNPEGVEHGGPTDEIRHVGDLGNLSADEGGTATADFVDEHIKLSGPHSIIGRGVIIHAGQDDFVSQPTGNAGPRMGCGVVGIANPSVMMGGMGD